MRITQAERAKSCTAEIEEQDRMINALEWTIGAGVVRRSDPR